LEAEVGLQEADGGPGLPRGQVGGELEQVAAAGLAGEFEAELARGAAGEEAAGFRGGEDW